MSGNGIPLIIVNPVSRGGRGASSWGHAASALRAQVGGFECRFTDAPGAATRIAREEASRGRKLLVAFGGDGTISETARGILAAGTKAALGILPHGTGGDLVRSLGVPGRIADAAAVLRRGRTVEVDAGRVVLEDGTERSFLNAASCGLSAEVASRMNRRKEKARYFLETLAAAAEMSCPEIEVAFEGGPFRSAPMTSLSIHNGRYFGGGMKMAPEASVTDGLLDVVAVKRISFAKLVRSSPLLYLGAHLALGEVEHGRARRIEARAARPAERIGLEIDGESGFALPVRFEVVPRALRVRV